MEKESFRKPLAVFVNPEFCKVHGIDQDRNNRRIIVDQVGDIEVTAKRQKLGRALAPTFSITTVDMDEVLYGTLFNYGIQLKQRHNDVSSSDCLYDEITAVNEELSDKRITPNDANEKIVRYVEENLGQIAARYVGLSLNFDPEHLGEGLRNTIGVGEEDEYYILFGKTVLENEYCFPRLLYTFERAKQNVMVGSSINPLSCVHIQGHVESIVPVTQVTGVNPMGFESLYPAYIELYTKIFDNRRAFDSRLFDPNTGIKFEYDHPGQTNGCAIVGTNLEVCRKLADALGHTKVVKYPF